MAGRKKFVAGNWKMFTTRATATALAEAVAKGVTDDRVTVAVCPPFPYLLPVADAVRGSKVAVGAQDVYFEKEGAFTGEVSPAMLLDAGCKYVIVGHSERRHKLGEDNALINRKVRASLDAGLTVILCFGETLEEHDAGRIAEVLYTQVTTGLTGVPGEQLAKLVLAYEPVWAIGTGRTATPEHAQHYHNRVRTRLLELYDEEAVRSLRILYGGSVTPDNATQLMAQPDVDGALVGGASLTAEKFLPIVRAAVG
jgi:triosephosphate isomerase